MVLLRIRRSSTRCVLLFMVVTFVSQPIGVAAAPLSSSYGDPYQELLEGGYTYLHNLSQGLEISVDLLSSINTIRSMSIYDLNEDMVITAREELWSMAEYTSIALGAVDDVIDGLEDLNHPSPEVVDISQILSEGLPDEILLGFVDVLGLPPSQVNEIEGHVQELLLKRLEVISEGLSPDLVDLLSDIGYSQEEINQIEIILSERGVTNTELITSRQQFRASQDELADTRTEALVLYLQLLSRQIAVRQLEGVAPRSVTDDELTELANDELRLLVHVAHLDELWGEDPRLEIGEGDWWFIERYASRAAERLEKLILETQNTGLAIDFLIVMQMQMLAISARSGDPEYVKTELDRFAQLLEDRIGEEGFVAAERAAVNGLAKIIVHQTSESWVREYIKWPIPEKTRKVAIRAVNDSLDNNADVDLVTTLFTPYDANVDNNTRGMRLVVGFSSFDQTMLDLSNVILKFVGYAEDGPEKMIRFLEVMVGAREPENPMEMVAVLIASFVPILDLVNDLITLSKTEDVFIKVLTIFSIVATLGELAYLLPAAVPLGAASTVADGFTTGVRGLYFITTKHGDVYRVALNFLEVEDAFDVGGGLISVAARRMVDDGLSLGDDAVEVVTEFLSESTNLWDDFLEYVARAGKGGPDLLIELGFDEGSQLIGSMLRQTPGFDFSDDMIRFVDDFGDDLFATVGRLSDDAAPGVGRMVGDAGEEGAHGLLRGLNCVLSSAATSSLTNSIKLASPFPIEGGCNKSYFEAVYQILPQAAPKWTVETLEGAGKTVRLSEPDGLLRLFDANQENLDSFYVIYSKSDEIWTPDSVEGLARTVERLKPTSDLKYLVSIEDETVVRDVLLYIRNVDLDDETNAIARVEDILDFVQWKKAGNSLDTLDDEAISLSRRIKTQSEYPNFREILRLEWGDEVFDNEKRLAEAVGVETGIQRLLSEEKYKFIYRNTNRLQGPDAVLKNTETGQWVILEGKGTYTGRPLEASLFPVSEDLGLEASKQWIITNPERYLEHIDNPETLRDLTEMVRDIGDGKSYELVISRGGYNPIGGRHSLEYGGGLSELVNKLRPIGSSGQNWAMRFLFENILGN